VPVLLFIPDQVSKLPLGIQELGFILVFVATVWLFILLVEHPGLIDVVYSQKDQFQGTDIDKLNSTEIYPHPFDFTLVSSGDIVQVLK
jgi:hypothetical protein